MSKEQPNKQHKPKTKIIFCTAYSDYALDAYNVNAVGYLLKPITEKQIREKLKQLDEVLSAPVFVSQNKSFFANSWG